MHLRTLALIGLLLGVLPSPAFALQQITLYGDDAYPPYSYIEDAQYKGIYVDFLRAAGSRLSGYTLVLKPVPWKRGLAMLETGEAVGLFPPYRIQGRNYIAGYSVPLFHEVTVVACRAEAMTRPRKRFPADFADVRLGINAGFALSNRLQQVLRSGELQVDEVKGNDINLRKLASGRIDCYINDRLAIFHTLKQIQTDPRASEEVRRLRLVEAAEVSGEDAYIGYGVDTLSPRRIDFVQKLDAVIRQLKREGVMERLVRDYVGSQSAPYR